MALVTHTIYNEQGEIIETKMVEIDMPTTEELIAEKEALLIQIYEEIKALKGE